MIRELPAGVGLTALAVADARARKSGRADRLFDDPFARLFIGAAGAAFAAESTDGTIDIRAMRAEYVAVRTRYFDDALLDACAAGCRQVVLLAAGLDARAFRLEWRVSTRVFELDMTDVLAFKARVLSAHAAEPNCERVVVTSRSRKLRQPTIAASGRRTPGLKLDDPRLLAVMQALTCFAHLSRGGRFRTRDLHQRAAETLGLTTTTYRLSQLRYDLARLRVKSLVVKVPKTQTYRLTPPGLRICLLFLNSFIASTLHSAQPLSTRSLMVPSSRTTAVVPSTTSTPASTMPSIDYSTISASASRRKRDARTLHRPTP